VRRTFMIWSGLLLSLGHGAQPARAKCSVTPIARLPVTMDGLRASVPVEVNGKATQFWLDSGAFFSIMSKARAAELGLKTESLPPWFYISGIGGKATVELTTIKSFKLVGNALKNLQFLVGGSDAGEALIGQNILAIGDTEYDLANGTVNLMQTKDCRNTSLAYWAGDKPYGMADLVANANPQDRHISAKGEINGQPVRMTFDTGAPTSLLTRSAAKRVGVDLDAPGVIESMNMSGFGAASRRSWIAKLKSFNLGGEGILNTPIRVIDDKGDSGGDWDMLIGADFFLSHHLFVSPATRRLFLTYNGGPVFSLSTDGEIGASATRTEGNWGSASAAVPTDAAGFARRASAKAARGDWKAAIADYSEAIQREPGNAGYWRDRAKAQTRAGQDELAQADFDKAIALAPGDPELLVSRGFVRLKDGDSKGALADAEAAAAGHGEGSLDRLTAVALFDRLHRPDRVLALIDPIIALHRGDNTLGELLNTRCWTRALANVELAKALADCNTAIKRDGPLAAYLDSRAMVKVRMKDWPGALADYDAALAKNPKQASSLYMRGWAKRASTTAGSEADKAVATGFAADMAAAKAIDPDVADQFTPYGLEP
jgi:predicted aspartyl protease/tetratricopeptide (TPR) repeat protein